MISTSGRFCITIWDIATGTHIRYIPRVRLNNHQQSDHHCVLQGEVIIVLVGWPLVGSSEMTAAQPPSTPFHSKPGYSRTLSLQEACLVESWRLVVAEARWPLTVQQPLVDSRHRGCCCGASLPSLRRSSCPSYHTPPIPQTLHCPYHTPTA